MKTNLERLYSIDKTTRKSKWKLNPFLINQREVVSNPTRVEKRERF